jgi:WD40 repeat protein
MWDAATGRELLFLKRNALKGGTVDVVTSVAFSPDGSRLAGAGSAEVFVWDGRPSTRELRD